MSNQPKKKILVVDDTLEIRNIAQLIFKQAGFDVITTTDGVEALKILKDQAVDLIFSDFRMPSLGGDNWLSLVQHHYPNVKKIFTSGYPFVVNIVPAETPFLKKPIRWDEAVILIRKTLGI